MAMTERQQNRLRHVLETVMRADDTIMDIADERAGDSPGPEDERLDSIHEALTLVIEQLQTLLGG